MRHFTEDGITYYMELPGYEGMTSIERLILQVFMYKVRWMRAVKTVKRKGKYGRN